MNKSTVAVVSAVLLATGSAGLTQETDRDGLAWIAGCWAHEGGGAREVWTGSHGGLHFGHSVTWSDGRPVAFEDLRIEPRGGGAVYVAMPNGGAGTAFTERERGAMSVTFVNAEHDYPQLIRYEREGDRMTATIALADGSEANSFAMRRCG